MRKVQKMKVNNKHNDFEETKNLLNKLKRIPIFKEHCEELMYKIDEYKEKQMIKSHRASYIAPCRVDPSVFGDNLPEQFKRNGKRRGKVPQPWMFKGEFYTLNELAFAFGLSYSLILQRLNNGMSPVRAFGVLNHRIDVYIERNMELMEI